MRVEQKQSRSALAICCGAHTLHDGLTDLLYVLLPVLAQAFGLNYSRVGLIRSVNKGAMAVFQLPAGLLSERLGERKLLAFGTACAGISYIWLGFAPGFIAVLTALFFAGVGASFQHPLSSAVISNAYPAEGRRIALGTYNFFGDVGKVAVAGSTGIILAAGIVGGMAGKIACGYLAERLGVIRSIVITEVATGVGILLILVLPPFAAYLLLPFIGVALNGTSSMLYV